MRWLRTMKSSSCPICWALFSFKSLHLFTSCRPLSSASAALVDLGRIVVVDDGMVLVAAAIVVNVVADVVKEAATMMQNLLQKLSRCTLLWFNSCAMLLYPRQRSPFPLPRVISVSYPIAYIPPVSSFVSFQPISWDRVRNSTETTCNMSGNFAISGTQLSTRARNTNNIHALLRCQVSGPAKWIGWPWWKRRIHVLRPLDTGGILHLPWIQSLSSFVA